MTTNKEIVDEAISHSQLRDCVAWIGTDEASLNLHHLLTQQCDNYATTDLVAEYWGSDQNGEWRVHVRGFGGATGLLERLKEDQRAAERDREGTLYAAYARAKGTEGESAARAAWFAFVEAEAQS